MTTQSYPPQVVRFAIISILYVLVVLSVPLALPIMILWWFIATTLIKWQFKNARIVEGVCNWFTYIDSNYQSCVSAYFLCSGTPDFEKIKKALLEKFALKHSLLQHYVERRYGYAFWMKERNFDIDDHVLWRPDLNVSNAEEHREVVQKLHEMPFNPKKSQWRFVVFPHKTNFQGKNGRPSYTIQCIYNHAIADGHSMSQAFYDAVSDVKVVLPEPKRTSVPLWYNVITYIRCIPYFPYFAIMLLGNQWNMFREKPMTEERLISLSPNFPVDTIRRIKNATKTSFVDVTQSCIVGAMRKYYLRHDIPMVQNLHLGKAFVLRTSNDEQSQLENNYFFYSVELPVVPDGSVRDRLIAINRNSNSLYNVAMMKLTALFFGMVHIVPKVLGSYLANNLSTTVYLGTSGAFTGDTPIFGNGNQMHEVCVKLCVNRKQGIALLGYTQSDAVQMTLIISPLLAKGQQEADLFLKDMEDELKDLDKSIQ